MRITFFVSLLVITSLCVLALSTRDGAATHGGMDAMSIDTNEEAAPANTSTSIGSRESCQRINENNVLDADEDVVDGLNIDVTAEGIPAYSNNSTPGDLTDDTGGIVGYEFQLGYSSSNLTVDSYVATNSAINIVAANPGSSLIVPSDAAPDDNADDVWYGAALDISNTTPESGTGNLHRITIVSEATAISGVYPLTLSGNIHVPADLNGYFPHQTNNGYVTVNIACGDFDQDGVPDAEDACPSLPGTPSNSGCPPPGPPVVGGTVGLVSDQRLGQSESDTGPRSYLSLLAGALAAAVVTAAGLYAGARWALVPRRHV